MTIDVEKLIALAQAATPGPWHSDCMYVVGEVPGGRPGGEVIIEARMTVTRHDTRARQEKDASYIAAMNPQTALALLRELRLARKTIEWVIVEAKAREACCEDNLDALAFLGIAHVCEDHQAACAKQSEGRES